MEECVIKRMSFFFYKSYRNLLNVLDEKSYKGCKNGEKLVDFEMGKFDLE